MKKLLLFMLVVSGLFAARYPLVLEYYYMNSCVKEGKNNQKQISYCACTLEKIEKKYSLNEFVNSMQTNKDAFLKELAKTVIPKCLDKLVK